MSLFQIENELLFLFVCRVIFRLDMIQLIPLSISPFLDHSLVMQLATTQLSALAVTSMFLVAGLSVLIMDREVALSMVRPEQDL